MKSGLIILLVLPLCIAKPTVFQFSQEDFLNFLQDGDKKAVKDEPEADVPVCGYKGCDLGKDGMLNVHLVPHTHDDVGWLKTVDQYFYGAHNEIQHAGVQYILDSVVDALQKNPERRFIYVEIAFFYRWWNQQLDMTRHAIQELVNEGRLEFILGGWCMNDEASTHYNAIIDQHTRGFKFIKEVFGDCGRPKIGWQIDPFGHSREQASLFAQFGFDAMYFGRLDFEDKDARLKDHTMEMVWMGSANLGDQASLFTGVNYNMYQAPPNFCFDIGCPDAPIMDDPSLHDYNVEDRVTAFIKAAKDQAQHYTTNHIMMTMGSDFQYQNAHENFKNLDKLIKYVNEYSEKNDSKVNVFYSTPSCYTYAMNKVGNVYTTKSDDFFPYASRNHTFWTGYFTSRPALKGYGRTSNNFLQVCKQMAALANLDATTGSEMKMDELWRSLGVAQHHDAISGTEKQAVAYDYAERIAYGISQCQEVVDTAFQKLLPLKPMAPVQKQEFCQLLNVSYCPTSEKNAKFTVTFYNPIGRDVTYWARIPVTGHYNVLGPDMRMIQADLVPISDATRKVPAHNGSAAVADLVFQVTLPPLGFQTYFIEQATPADVSLTQHTRVLSTSGDMAVENEFISLTFDGTTGLLKSMMNKEKQISSMLQQTLMYYKAFKGDNHNASSQSSGAYCFRPNGTEPLPIAATVHTTFVKGNEVQEVRQVFSDWASQVYRIYKGERYAEVEWTVGPIPFKDGIGKEVISKYMSDLQSESTFYTDANGREVLKRVKNFRPTWKLNQSEPVSSNYYPVNSRIYIQDKSKMVQLTVLNDRSQGGSSIMDGEMELMVHRRLLHDDSFGAGEPLNETGISGNGLVVRGKEYIFLDSIADSGHLHRDLGERLFMAPSTTFSQLTKSPQEYKTFYRTMWSGLMKALPANVHVLTLQQWHDMVLLRLEHFYEMTDDSVLSKPVTVSLKNLFASFKIASAEELILGANAKLSDVTRLQWKTQRGGSTESDMSSFVEPLDADLHVTLNPMQIRTFQLTLMTEDKNI